MNGKEVKIQFIFEVQEVGFISSKEDDNIKEVCQKFASQNEIDFNKVFFLFN